jgi:hypothetical protein
MSLYNMLFGVNPFSGVLLEVLGISEADVPRYRDCYLSEDGTEIIIHTRTGGGNRADYQDENASLTKVPGYKGDSDDDYDYTYANFRYDIPQASKSMVALIKEMGAVSNPAERWQSLLENMRGGDTSNPDVKRALAIGEKIFGQIDAAMRSGESGKIIEI